MPDPLRITTGVITLLGAVAKATLELQRFHDGATVISQTIADLENDINGLKRVLKSMRAAFETIAASEGTGHIASHWTNVAQAMSDGSTMLERLHVQIQQVDKETSFLSDHRKQFRLERTQSKVTALRINDQSSRDCLQLSLQTIILWNQVSGPKTSDPILPSLNRLHTSVRRIARELNDRI